MQAGLEGRKWEPAQGTGNWPATELHGKATEGWEVRPDAPWVGSQPNCCGKTGPLAVCLRGQVLVPSPWGQGAYIWFFSQLRKRKRKGKALPAPQEQSQGVGR